MLSFFAGAFAVAGLVAAAGPIVIHLLNRRRYRTVDWAAMDFLREALQRNRRILQLRDLILLLLRILAVAAVGLALARPFFTSAAVELPWRYGVTVVAVLAAFGLAVWAVLTTSRANRIGAGLGCAIAVALSGWGVAGVVEARELAGAGANAGQPVHAVLVFDNSASMGYESLDGGNLLGLARERALEFVEKLPAESRVSVLPLCGSPGSFSYDAYRNREDVRDAIERIEVVDRGGEAARVNHVIDLASEACRQVPELSAKRVVYLGDQQLGNWPAGSLENALDDLPELQIVQVAPAEPSNVWVSDFRVQDDIADTEVPAVFLATIRHQGPSAISDVTVSLVVDGVSVSTRTLELEPGQESKQRFAYRIDVPAEPGVPTFVTARLEVETRSTRDDGVKSDNVRYLTVPVVAGLPVVFVDSVGASEEDAGSGTVGETLPLRRLLAPIVSRDEAQPQLVDVRHVTIAELDRETLADARLCVIAGVESPGSAETVDLLREYVAQGGQLAILAGDEFNPVKWTELAWRDGGGILPAPIDAEPLGKSFDEAAGPRDLEPFGLDFDSMLHRYFQLEQESFEDLEALYREPIFVKAVRARVDDDVLETLVENETSRIREQRAFLEESAARFEEWQQREREGTLTETDEALRAQDEERRRTADPDWLAWDRETVGDELAALAPEELARRSRPQVLAAYTKSQAPFLVSRQIGHGRVQLFTTGIRPEWNTLSATPAMAMFVRVFGLMLSETLPPRNFDTGQPIQLPARPGDRLRYSLRRGEAVEDEMLVVEAMGPDAYGVAVRNAFHRGHLYVVEEEVDPTAETLAALDRREIPLSVNGPVEESELATIDEVQLRERLGAGNYRWIQAGEEISLEGAEIRGRDLWQWLIRIALACLLAEMIVLALPTLRRGTEETA